MTPYYAREGVRLYLGDCREVLQETGPVDVVIADPPYGETTLRWDKCVRGWVDRVSSDSLWCFGSMKFFLRSQAFSDWTLAQDIVWEKHNGSGMHADRFRRVHEHALHFYRGPWAVIYKKPVMTNDARAKVVRRKEKPAHMGPIAGSTYKSIDGGPRFMRSVLHVRSCHGHADHPTQKPVALLLPLVEYSCPPTGTVLDPFTGSGSTGEACIRLGRKFIGIEIEERWCEHAAKRLDRILSEPRLPFVEESSPPAQGSLWE